MCCESLFVRVLRGMTTTKKDSDEQTTDDLNTLFHSSPSSRSRTKITLHSPFYISISEETKAHDEHTRARSLTRTTIRIHI